MTSATSCRRLVPGRASRPTYASCRPDLSNLDTLQAICGSPWPLASATAPPGPFADPLDKALVSRNSLDQSVQIRLKGPTVLMPSTMKISAQFATSLQSPEHTSTAEQIGYDRAWLFDTPHESPDVWMMLALAAERTTTIGLGPGVLVPALRHPMVNASAAAALAALAPGRVAIAFGTGFAGARAPAQPVRSSA